MSDHGWRVANDCSLEQNVIECSSCHIVCSTSDIHFGYWRHTSGRILCVACGATYEALEPAAGVETWMLGSLADVNALEAVHYDTEYIWKVTCDVCAKVIDEGNDSENAVRQRDAELFWHKVGQDNDVCQECAKTVYAQVKLQ